ncbi:SpoIIE family protein phosphatase [Streptomyces sp. NPDC090025]|uniref:SpoIIE family protein phosphatase n=1 Tax=Streptomyces sp. NPDC090025 TaxID=3365922 RepID=UPI00383262F4
MLVLQLLIVVLLVAAAVTALVLKARGDRVQAARARSLAAAESFAHSPGLPDVLRGPDPTAVLQPLTEDARGKAGVDFIVVMGPDGVRLTSPVPAWIGAKFTGTVAPSLAGQVTIENLRGPDGGREVQAVVPVTDAGRVVGVVAAGLTLDRVNSAIAHQVPVLVGAGLGALALATAGTALIGRRLRRQTHGLGPAEMTRMYEHHDAVLHAVREGVVVTDADGRVLLANVEARRLLDAPAGALEGRPVAALGLDARVTDLLTAGRGVSDEVLTVGDRLLAVNARPTRTRGGPAGLVTTLRDATELRDLTDRAELARGRLRMLYDATVAVGTTLDVTRTAQELTDVATRRFADYATVDLAEAVLSGEEPSPGSYTEVPELRRVALSGAYGHPLYQVGEVYRYRPDTPMARTLIGGEPVLVPEMSVAVDWLAGDPERTRLVLSDGFHSLVSAPLKARGVLMGIANFWRMGDSPAFDEEDLGLAGELAARAAVCVDNARRFTREHTMAVALQHSLLPGGPPEQLAVETAHRYLPARTEAGGDWYDVIPLPGARVALVVGDTVGHGVHAAAAMGRLRTAVQNLSIFDLPPDELLGRLDELVRRIDHGTAPDAGHALAGAGCLYAIHDPTTGVCTMARAGSPSLAVVRPDGTVDFPEPSPGPPLGIAGRPYELLELALPETTTLVLFTEGLLRGRGDDVAEDLDRLTSALSGTPRPPEETCTAVLDAMAPLPRHDDVTVLAARTRRTPSDRIAEWDVPCEPSAVAGARAEMTRHLNRWGLEELVFVTELILSELVTNVIRYAPGPITVRLVLDRTLICEVYDTRSTAPHLRYAADEDEGGRGLFLIAQMAERWGTRYSARGKVIWAEQALP